VTEVAPHPNADKLSICRVTDGAETFSVVCGAPNVSARQTVLLAKTGSVLAGGFKLKKTKIRGCESSGMICAEDEIGLGERHEGIIVLPEDTPLGSPLAEVPGLCDVQFETSITPNRPDALCHIGVAREIAAFYKIPLKLPALKRNWTDTAPPSSAELRVDVPEDCSLYTGKVLRNVNVGPSPEWLVRALQNVGQKSINNVVDITNYVLLEYGQPSHAFDLDKVKEGRVIIRRAKKGESLQTLDEIEREVDSRDLVIADDTNPICMAGVMGGESTKVDENTKNIFLEVAYFSPPTVRQQSKRHNLSTDSSYCFERGVDPLNVSWISDYLAEMLMDVTGGTVEGGTLRAVSPDHPALGRTIKLRKDRVAKILGVNLEMKTMAAMLKGIQITEEDSGGQEEWSVFKVPGFRVDLEREVDLIEEVARLFNYNNIPAQLPSFSMQASRLPPIEKLSSDIRSHLSSQGLNECISLRFTAPKYFDKLMLPPEAVERQVVKLKNPLSEEWEVLPSILLINLLKAVSSNQKNQENNSRLFEIGKTFLSCPDDLSQRNPGVSEEDKLAIVLSGDWRQCSWKPDSENANLFILKGLIENLEPVFKRSLTFDCSENVPFLHPKETSIILSGEKKIGYYGSLHPQVLSGFDIKGPCLVCEISLEKLLSEPEKSLEFKPIGKFSSIVREMNIVIDENITHEKLLSWMPLSLAKHLEKVQLNNIYKGKGLEKGKKAMHYSFVYRHPDRTLTDEEVNRIQERLAGKLLKNPAIGYK
jgi:phenylalanyl-tRNA synthetase beta chain